MKFALFPLSFLLSTAAAQENEGVW